MSIESASCCRRASSVPTSCAESKGDGLIPGHSSPARGPGDQATDRSGCTPRFRLQHARRPLPRRLQKARVRIRGWHLLRSCPVCTHDLSGPSLGWPRLSGRPDPATQENRVLDTSHPAPRRARSPRPSVPPIRNWERVCRALIGGHVPRPQEDRYSDWFRA